MKIIGNNLEVNLLTGKTTLCGTTMSTSKFKKMCFKNGWEGTLSKICTAEEALRKAVEKAKAKGGEG